MKKIDTWLDIQHYLSEATRMSFPKETREFIRLDVSEVEEVKQQIRKGAVSICVA